MDEGNRNRLEEFRQLRQEIRQSEEHLIVGIDIAKDRHHAFFGTATGKTLLRRLVPLFRAYRYESIVPSRQKTRLIARNQSGWEACG